MAIIDLRATQKSYRPKPVEDYKAPIEDLELRMSSIEQSLNLILKKLDNGNINNGNNISSISKERTKRIK